VTLSSREFPADARRPAEDVTYVTDAGFLSGSGGRRCIVVLGPLSIDQAEMAKE